MKHKVEVTIERYANKVVVKNEYGKTWEFPFEIAIDNDTSAKGAIADIAAAMLTGTIASHLQNTNSKKLKYTLTVQTW